jgi:2-dehydropantoate 2-reductase
MHVTVVGAGVLGRIYGARLAADGEEVAFVVRPDRAAETSPFFIEQVNAGDRREVIDHPVRLTEIPEGTDLVLVAVRFHELLPASPGAEEGELQNKIPKGFDLREILRGGGSLKAPVVVLTPMLQGQAEALNKASGRPIVPAMPGVAGYLNERGAVRYWIPAATSTLLDENAGGPSSRAALEALARHLSRIGLPTRLERDVAALNASTTITFFPLIAAIDAGSGIDGVLGNKEFMGAVLGAAKESEALARKVGKPATWGHLLMKFVGPLTLKPGVALARRLFPESVRFVESHFGPKLHEQHLAMGESILELGRANDIPMPALERLLSILRRRQAAG